MTIRLHRGDLPDLTRYQTGAVAVDTETMGLEPRRDRLCVVQLSPGDDSADVVQVSPGLHGAPNLTKLLVDPNTLKIFHFARFDLAMLSTAFGVMPGPIHCTKIASRLARAYSDKHGLKDLVRELLMCCICMRSGGSSMPCWPARGASSWPPPASAFCPIGSGSTWRAGGRRTFLPIPSHEGPGMPRPGHICARS